MAQQMFRKLACKFERGMLLLIATVGGIMLTALGTAPALAQEAAKPVIKVIATGGTMAHLPDGRILSMEQVIADIRKNYPDTHKILDKAKLEVIELLRAVSGDMSGENFLQIARTVNKVIQEPGVKGVIVTGGTASAEDEAFFLHLLVRSDKPVVVTFSQRNHTTVSSDGGKNFVDAVSVVLSPQAVGKGALLVQNQTINSGREVVKTSERPGAFDSGEYGILGVVEEYTDRVDFYRAPLRRHTLHSEFDVNSITALPPVEIIYAYYDANPALIHAAVGAGAKGLVINGFTHLGAPFISQLPMLKELADKGLPIVLTSRGGVDARIRLEPGDKFIGGDNLPAHKARILLQLALTKASDPKEIQRIFNEY